MKTRIIFLPLVIAVLVAFSVPLPAQIIADGSTTTLNAITNAFSGDVVVGTNGSLTLLTLATNVLVTNSGNCVIGLNAGAKSNEVRLISPTARWLMNGSLFVGSNGTANRLVVSNGALARSVYGYVGPYIPASNNVAIISGAGSTWSNNNIFYLGFNGAGNQLVVSNGGILRANGSIAGVNTSSSNNYAIVTGPGSLWSNATSLQFGYGGPGNQLVISNGGAVRSSIGVFGSGVSASNTLVTVTGNGSLWTNMTDFYVGQSSVGNQLLVSNGGAVRNGNGFVGANFTGSNNLAMVTGAGSVWSNALDLNVGAYSGFNQAIVSNGGAIFVAGNGIIGPTTSGNGNAVTVSGASSHWLIGTNLYIGSNGALSQLTIADGGRVENLLGTIGSSASSSNNIVVVTGADSVWSNALPLYLGDGGRGNQLWITNGGVVQDALAYAGHNFTSSSNLAVVAGPGSLWTNTGELYFGWSGAGNQLVVSNAGTVRDLLGYVGFATSSSNNLALVTGAGSLWSNSYELYVGGNGSGNQLVVSNGGRVQNSIGYVGGSVSSSNNLAVVAGAGSVWTNLLHHFLGYDAPRNQLVVSNGAVVMSGGGGIIGFRASAPANIATITDAGSAWLLSSNLYVGSNGALNQLIITNGALVSNATGTLGQNVSSTNNLVVVTGAGSGWRNAGDLFIGRSGAGNQFAVRNGGAVWDYTAEIGSGSSSNVAIVTGPGSVWSNANNLLIGRSGSFNQLVVSNGGAVLNENNYAYMSTSSLAGTNLAVVTGAGSRWISFGALIGESGAGNRVVVTNGGFMQSVYTYLGFDSSGSSSNNLVLVTGSGSVWSNVGDFFVGYSGRANQLILSNGGVLSGNGNVLLGFFPASTNNRLEVTGGALVVSNGFGDGKLDIRRGTNVLNAGLIAADQLLLNNPAGCFEFNGGTLRTGSTTVNNGQGFFVGNGTGAATFQLQGGAHAFANNLFIAPNSVLMGTGTIDGILTVQSGATLAPGASIGELSLNNSPILQGATLMEIDKFGSTATNDQLQVNGPINFGGSLTVTNIGAAALVAGDRFKLFSALAFVGSFASVSLPPLGFNLTWTNKLAVDGSIEVVGGPVPEFTSFAKSGTNLVLTGTGGIANTTYVVLTATNITLPLNQWTSIATNQFGVGGSFAFTNGISPGTPQRFFRLRWP